MKTWRLVLPALTLLVSLGCEEDPEGICELSGRVDHCMEKTKSRCEESGGRFHETGVCQTLGYTQKEGIIWIRPIRVTPTTP